MIADILWGVRHDMRYSELGWRDSFHQIFILSQAWKSEQFVILELIRDRTTSSPCKFALFSALLRFQNDRGILMALL